MSSTTRKNTIFRWIWYIFPQMKGLGHSDNASYYGISGLDEAQAYLTHETLVPRLRKAAETVLSIEGRTINEKMPGIDAPKLRSSMTLFDRVCPKDFFASVLKNTLMAGVMMGHGHCQELTRPVNDFYEGYSG